MIPGRGFVGAFLVLASCCRHSTHALLAQAFLAHSLYRQEHDAALFLRAERRPDGQRTFRLVEGEPLPTSYGEDSYRRILGEADASRAGGALLKG
jgi:hypothetical protein